MAGKEMNFEVHVGLPGMKQWAKKQTQKALCTLLYKVNTVTSTVCCGEAQAPSIPKENH